MSAEEVNTTKNAKINIISYENPYIKWDTLFMEIYNSNNEKLIIYYSTITNASLVGNTIQISADDILLYLNYSDYSDAKFNYNFLINTYMS